MSKIIKALMIEPKKHPRLVYLTATLNAFREAISIGSDEIGEVQSKRLKENIYVIFNAAGLLSGLDVNRKVKNKILVGVIYIVATNESFHPISLTKKQIEKYTNRFWNTEEFSDLEVVEYVLDSLGETLKSFEF